MKLVKKINDIIPVIAILFVALLLTDLLRKSLSPSPNTPTYTEANGRYKILSTETIETAAGTSYFQIIQNTQTLQTFLVFVIPADPKKTSPNFRAQEKIPIPIPNPDDTTPKKSPLEIPDTAQKTKGVEPNAHARTLTKNHL